MNTKAIIDFTGYTAANLGALAQVIHDKLAANAASFPSPPLTVAALQTQITDYDQKLVARASRASSDVLAFNTARDALEVTLGSIGNYVNTVAKGDPVLVDQSGVPSYGTGHTPPSATPTAPTNLRLKHGELSGSIVARYKADRQPSTNEVQCCSGDPNNAADWHTVGMYMGNKAVISGCTPGAVVWVRVRTVGQNAIMGTWSDPAQIRTL